MTALNFEKVFHDISATPMAPTATAKSDVNQDPVAYFNRAIKVYERQIMQWRTSMIMHEPTIRHMLSEAEKLGPDFLKLTRDTQFQRAIDTLSEEIAKLKDGPDGFNPATIAKLELAARMDPKAAVVVKNIRKRMRRAWVEHQNWMIQLYFRLLAIQADFDPDSRGGPSFTNADDLFASLDA